MVNFFIYDLAFLVVFSLVIGLFLYKHRKNLEKEGIMYLYRTKLGIKFIEKFSKKSEKVLKFISPLVILTGFVLMFTILYLLVQTAQIYITEPQITEIISAPPIAPLIPYFPQIFGMESFFPPFYFTYFLLALLIVAVVHEFSHGVFMKTFGMKIKSTGFAFLGPILGAFVEEDKKTFLKKNNYEQMTVLSAGVFANILFGFIFFGLLVLFFSLAYVPAGFAFNAYAPVSLNEDLLNDLNSTGNLIFLERDNLSIYYRTDNLKLDNLGVIKKINELEVKSFEDVKIVLSSFDIGEEVLFEIFINGETKKYELAVDVNPRNDELNYFGFSSLTVPQETFKQKVLGIFSNYKNSSTYYESRFNSAEFFSNLFWWIMIINFLVALFNMLPLSILDGGRFFYLTILSITRSEKRAKQSFRLMGYFILILFLIMIFFWLIGIIF